MKKRYEKGDSIIVKIGKYKTLKGTFNSYETDYGYYTPYVSVKVKHLDGDIQIVKLRTSYIEKLQEFLTNNKL